MRHVMLACAFTAMVLLIAGCGGRSTRSTGPGLNITRVDLDPAIQAQVGSGTVTYEVEGASERGAVDYVLGMGPLSSRLVGPPGGGLALSEGSSRLPVMGTATSTGGFAYISGFWDVIWTIWVMAATPSADFPATVVTLAGADECYFLVKNGLFTEAEQLAMSVVVSPKGSSSPSVTLHLRGLTSSQMGRFACFSRNPDGSFSVSAGIIPDDLSADRLAALNEALAKMEATGDYEPATW